MQRSGGVADWRRCATTTTPANAGPDDQRHLHHRFAPWSGITPSTICATAFAARVPAASNEPDEPLRKQDSGLYHNRLARAECPLRYSLNSQVLQGWCP